MGNNDLVILTADIVAAHVSHNSVTVSDIGTLVQQVHGALSGLAAPQGMDIPAKVPAVSIRASIKPDYLICMECGTRKKALKRHLQSAHGTTPQRYREEFGLPPTYPMVSPNYSKLRTDVAKAMGLGTKALGASKSAVKGKSNKLAARRGGPKKA